MKSYQTYGTLLTGGHLEQDLTFCVTINLLPSIQVSPHVFLSEVVDAETTNISFMPDVV